MHLFITLSTYLVRFCVVIILSGSLTTNLIAQSKPAPSHKKTPAKKKVLYGTASFYANKFNGRRTATGEIFSQSKYTCACNVLPLGTWIRVTNVRNGRSVVVRVNDRLNKNNKRLVDLTKIAAHKLKFVSRGLTKVKVEVLGKKRPKS